MSRIETYNLLRFHEKKIDINRKATKIMVQGNFLNSRKKTQVLDQILPRSFIFPDIIPKMEIGKSKR